jgi:hypothetical protein
MTPRARAGWVVCAPVLMAATMMVSAQGAAETFTATASVKRGAASATAPVTVTITRYGTDAERDAVMSAIRKQGSDGARTVLSGMSDAGFIELGGQRSAIKFAGQRVTGSGRLVTVVTAEPIVYLGAGLPGAQGRTGFDVAVAMLDLTEAGTGTGELAPAAKVGVDEHGAVLIDDYGATVLWLNDLVRKQ